MPDGGDDKQVFRGHMGRPKKVAEDRWRRCSAKNVATSDAMNSDKLDKLADELGLQRAVMPTG